MKIFFLLAILLLWKISPAQDTCKPQYGLPVQKLEVAPGLRMAYVEKGKGRTILFIHGLGGNLSHWLKQVDGLSESFRCIAVDLPGYGWSDKNVSTVKDQLAFYADVLLSFLEKKNIQNVILAGHSMGGQIAVITALQHPGKVSKLVLAAPVGLETFSEGEGSLLLAATPPAFFARQDEATIRAAFKQNFYAQPDDAEALIKERLRLRFCADFAQYTEAVSAGIKGMLQHPVKKDLANIKQPVLVLFGENDALIPNRVFHPDLQRGELINEVQALLPEAKVVTIPAAGHLVQFEKDKITTKAIKDFLK